MKFLKKSSSKQKKTVLDEGTLVETDQLGSSCFQGEEGCWHEVDISGVNECFYEAELKDTMKNKGEKNMEDDIQGFQLVHSGENIVHSTEIQQTENYVYVLSKTWGKTQFLFLDLDRGIGCQS